MPAHDLITTELLLAAGDGLMVSLLNLFNYMKKTITIPHQCEIVTITTIYKGRGSKRELINQKGIFLTSAVSKVFEKLVKKRIDSILKNVSIFQAGARSNRGTVDNLFLLR